MSKGLKLFNYNTIFSSISLTYFNIKFTQYLCNIVRAITHRVHAINLTSHKFYRPAHIYSNQIVTLIKQCIIKQPIDRLDFRYIVTLQNIYIYIYIYLYFNMSLLRKFSYVITWLGTNNLLIVAKCVIALYVRFYIT